MAKKKRKRKSQALAAATEAGAPQEGYENRGSRPVRWDLIAIFLLIAIGGSYLALMMKPRPYTPRYTYKVTNKYKHDAAAFTQGLVWEDGILWESTGRYGESTLRKVDMKSGKVLKQISLPEDQFGEGLTIWKDQLIQLTWKKGIAHVYDRDLNKIKEFKYEGEGWGLTHDGRHLILSDGRSKMRFLDPETFKEVKHIWVTDNGRMVSNLNELEYINGKILANQWKSDLVFEIDPKSGEVESVIDLTGIWPYKNRPQEGVLNGITLDGDAKKVLVTGKLCPHIYEVEFSLIEHAN